jgi:hypothetical protein
LPNPGQASEDLSLREAAVLYPIALRTLRTKVSRGEIPGYPVMGLRGRERRVPRPTLDNLGLRPRPCGPKVSAPQVSTAELERELAQAQRMARMERNRAGEADRELGYALLQCGRLRAAVTTLEHRLEAGLAARR